MRWLHTGVVVDPVDIWCSSGEDWWPAWHSAPYWHKRENTMQLPAIKLILTYQRTAAVALASKQKIDEWMNECMSEWIIDWLIYRLIILYVSWFFLHFLTGSYLMIWDATAYIKLSWISSYFSPYFQITLKFMNVIVNVYYLNFDGFHVQCWVCWFGWNPSVHLRKCLICHL